MSMYNRIFSALACTVLLGATFAGHANADEEVMASYAAKFVCRPFQAPNPDSDVVKGVYATSINIHNPNVFPLTFEKKIVFSPREGSSPGCIIPNTDTLGPDIAESVDCDVIQKKQMQCAEGTPSGEEGFVVLHYFTECLDRNCGRVSAPLDVVGKYTARPTTSEVSSLDVVVYPVQILPEVPILVVPE